MNKDTLIDSIIGLADSHRNCLGSQVIILFHSDEVQLIPEIVKRHDIGVCIQELSTAVTPDKILLLTTSQLRECSVTDFDSFTAMITNQTVVIEVLASTINFHPGKAAAFLAISYQRTPPRAKYRDEIHSRT